MSIHDIPFDAASDVTSIRYRLHPLDVGFDLRGEGITTKIGPEPVLRASYADRAGERRVIEGPREAVIEHLRRVGYRISEAP